jgi:two-component system chemotaxis response regulator CheY
MLNSDQPRLKTLVVDDDLLTRIALQEMLAGFGDVLSCTDGTEAIVAFRHALVGGSPYDLICMDLYMPKLGGIEALKVIRQEEAQRGRVRPWASKVIITTADDDSATIGQAFQGLCDAYLVKPVDATELVDMVQCLFPEFQPEV